MKIIPRSEARAQGLATYFTGAPCKHGHIALRQTLSATCTACQVAYRESEAGRAAVARSQSRPENRERSRLRSAEYHRANRDVALAKMSERNKRYYAQNAERIRSQAAAYQSENREQRNAYKARWQKERAKTDPHFAAVQAMRKLVARVVDRCVKERTERVRSAEALGYTAVEFRAHIESLWLPGMSWSNRSAWHIDHIKPVSLFDITDPEQRRAANALSNLQPLWKIDNLRKGARYG